MAQKKLGSLKKTDTIISGSVDLAADVSSTVLPVANGGTGSGSYTNGQLLIGNTTGNTLAKATLTGTADQITVTNGGGSITLSLPQSIATTSNVNFGFVTTTDLTVTDPATIDGITFGAGLGGVSGCLGVGVGALDTNVSGTRNVAVGNTSLEFLTTGIDNVAIGGGAGENIVGGGHNVFVGTDAAKLVNAGTSATAVTESIVIGDAARVSGSSNTNTIVIGSDGRGEGSNTTVIGNTSTTGCHLFGTLKIGDGTDSTKTATLDCSGITTGTNRTLTLPNSSGTIVIGGGTCSGASSGTNTGDQTSVSGNAGTATALATARAIYGNNFDGTAALTQVIASTYGGTGNGFTKFSGPATSEKTKTLSNANDTILEANGAYTVTGASWTFNNALNIGAGTGVVGPIVNGGNGTAEGAYLSFTRAGANPIYFGHRSGILGGTSNNAVIYSSASNVEIMPSATTVATFTSTSIAFVPKITTYNNIATVSNGVPSELGTADLTSQTAAKTATTLYTPAATGMFRVTCYLQVTTAATTSSILGGATGVVITFNDGDGNVAQSNTMALMTASGAIATTAAGNTTATNLTGSMIIYARTGVAVQYAIGYTSVGATPMAFSAHLKIEAL